MMSLFEEKKTEHEGTVRSSIEKIMNNPNWKDTVFIDTETTGFNGEVIEISIVNIHGVELFSKRVKPQVQYLEDGAYKTHKISLSDVAKCKYFHQIFPEVYGWVSPVNKKPPIIAYNVDFDVRIIKKSLELTKENYKTYNKRMEQDFFDSDFFCLMKLISMYNKENGENGKWMKLKDACSKWGVEADDSKLHGSSYDALMTSRLFLELAYKVGSPETIAKINLIRN